VNQFGKPRARPPLPDGPFLVVGLARSGAAVARMLAGRGERVLGCDSGHPPEAEGLAVAGVEVSLDVDGTRLVDEAVTVVKSPGVPQDAPAVAAARERGLDVVGELELAWRAIPNPFCAVTGTNGKTTTTELLGHLHREAGLPVAVAGNVGTPLASLAGKLGDDVTVVCECSSFQLEDTTEFAPESAVFINLAPDHLDRHGTIEAYLAAKLRIFAKQGNDDVAVYNAALLEGPGAHPPGGDLGGCARRVRFCPEPEASADPDCELSLREGVIFAGEEPLLRADELRLLGAHSVENAMAAAGAALATGIPRDAVAAGLRSFEGVPHRLERVRERAGVAYVNDSKATNVASALAGIRAFEGGLHLILGGSLKGESFEPLGAAVAERASACYLIGEAAAQLERDLNPASKSVELVRAGTLEAAVERAAEAAEPGEVVLLSPACASFDAFADFEARGERFRELVEALP
jgi:UDP-N-acetylmuramoylalanine--D-glutamate ligase